MSKVNSKVATPEAAISYSMFRKDSGYCIIKYTHENSKIVSSEVVSEPDVLVIAVAHLERMLRKTLGL